MCLTLKSNKAKSKIAKKDIICYKRLEFLPTIIDKSSIKDGDEFTGVINNMECSGKISIESDKIFFCTNRSKLNGADSKNKHGYINSWIFDSTVTSIIINNKEVIDLKLVTPYRNFPIEIGKTYDSELIKMDEDIYEGLHSYKNSEDAKKSYNGIYVECIIPKGSKYYEGIFADVDAYASDKLTYVKIIEDCSKLNNIINFKIMDLNNTVIKVLNKEHGAKVIAFYKKNGYDTKWFYGSNIGYHYGVINNNFSWYVDSDIKRYIPKVIELPEEKEYPKVMMVSDCPSTKGYKKRVVFMEKMGKYLAWSHAETIEESEKEVDSYTWKYAVDIPKENPQKTEMLKRVEELKSNIAKMQKQVDEIQAEAEKI